MVTGFFSPKIKSTHGWGQSHLKLDIQRFVLSTEPYFRAEIFQKQFWTFDQSLIFNVFSYIFKIKDKKRTTYRSYSLQQAGQLKTFHQMSQ